MKTIFFEPTEYEAIQNLLIFKFLQLLDPQYQPEKIPNYFREDQGVIDLIRLIPSRRSGAYLPEEAKREDIRIIPHRVKVFFIETKPILGKVYFEESLVGERDLRLNLVLRMASEYIDIYGYLQELAKESKNEA